MLLKRKLSSGLTNNGGGFLLNLFLKQHNAVARLHAPIYNTGDLVLNSSSSIVRSDLCSPAYSVIEKKKKKVFNFSSKITFLALVSPALSAKEKKIIFVALITLTTVTIF